ncbi:hypothetical protein [Flavobacterium sp.]|uniref:hypothetical protein n=1 Tax=Flavobacterium sp. TaxID=239 RepID=UPI00352860C0
MRKIISLLSVFVIALVIFGFTTHNTTEKSQYEIELPTTFADTLTWNLLGKIDYVKKKDKTYGEVMFPVVNLKLKALQGKPVVIKGFIIPIDNKNYAISKNVFASCFFCGKSGPETIMGIKFKGDLPKLKTDQYVTLKGTFRYNDSDVEDWIYHVENAVITAGK